MSKKNEHKAFLSSAKAWALKQKLFGPQAFLKFVIFTFIDCLAEETEDFIFKGGNLLWIYIKTPRQTVDLDLATIEKSDTDEIKNLLEKSCSKGVSKGIQFNLLSLKEVLKQGERGIAATIAYKTEEGASNTFDLDIVCAIPTEWQWINSLINSENKIRVASLENIIIDKVATCHRFKGGNTRMKDFDDLWRLSQSSNEIDWKKVKNNLKLNKATSKLDKAWLNIETVAAWKRHIKRYKDLPAELEIVFDVVNRWLK